MYKLNRTEPRTNPCGTPNGRCGGKDSVQDMLMLWCMSEKMFLKNKRDVPEMPNYPHISQQVESYPCFADPFLYVSLCPSVRIHYAA